jgi:hypothetical protein
VPRAVVTAGAGGIGRAPERGVHAKSPANVSVIGAFLEVAGGFE